MTQQTVMLAAIVTAVFLTSVSAASGREHHESNAAPRITPVQMSSLNVGKAHAPLPFVTHSLVINAQPEYVFAAIQQARRADTRKLLSYDGCDATIEEKFATLPVVGAATCTYIEHEIPGQGIDYRMVTSDRFTAFQGQWLLTPTKDGKGTIVQLSNAMDPGIRIPFWQDITKVAAGRNVKKRLDEVNKYALSLQAAASPRRFVSDN